MGDDGRGFLLPSWYVAQQPADTDIHIASILWGFSLSCALFTGTKALRQSWRSYKKGKLFNTYIIMVWAEWLVCVIISVLSWLYLSPGDIIAPGFWIFFGFLVLWVIQIQCIIQIIINRVRLLMADQRRADHFKWAAAAFVGLINISVFIIWIPARLQISQRWININNWWDRTEKVLFGLVDISLNIYFIYLVRSRLIDNGLTKYQKLLRFNMFMVLVSMALDGVLIGMMSLPNTVIYIQFHPLVYLIKLHIEMNVAELIAKIVRARNHMNEHADNRHGADIESANSTSRSSRRPTKSISSSKLRQLHSNDGTVEEHEFTDIFTGKTMTSDYAFEEGPDLECGGSDPKPVESHDVLDENATVSESTARGNRDSGFEDESKKKQRKISFESVET